MLLSVIAPAQVRNCPPAETGMMPHGTIPQLQLIRGHSVGSGFGFWARGIDIRTSLRVLVVDDFVPWRNYLVTKLGENPALQIVGMASDGREAVLKATELHPDLILMDVNLPELSGIQAAATILGLSPESKILFVSQNLDFDIALAALNAGGFGYLVKSDAESELLRAVEAVMSGERFVSALLASHDFAGVLGPQAPIRPRIAGSVELSARPLIRNATIGHSHEVAFYGDDVSFLVRCARFIGAALANGDAAIAIVTHAHRDRLRQKLESEGHDSAAAMEQGRYVALEPSEILSTFLVNDQPDAARFIKAASDLIVTALKAATGKHPRVAICGECPALLHAEGKAEAAVEMERLCNELASMYNVDSLCGYPIERFRSEEQGPIFQRICAQHSAVYSR
jgi:CheY-like chemotaxis protein